MVLQRSLARIGRFVPAFAAGALTLASLAGCGGGSGSEPDVQGLGDITVAVGYVERPESELLAAIYARALRNGGAGVERVSFAGEDAAAEAAAAGDIDLYPDETGRIHTAMAGGPPDADPAEIEATIAAALAERGLVGLAAAPADDGPLVACATATARDLGLRTLSDLAPVADQLTYAAEAEHLEQPTGLPALRRVYGIDFGRVLTTFRSRRIVRDPSHSAGRGYARIAAGQAACTHGHGTDPELAGADLAVLVDDRGAVGLPPAQPLPVANADVIASAPDALRTTLDRVSARLTDAELRRLRARVEIEGAPAAEVAAGFLN